MPTNQLPNIKTKIPGPKSKRWTRELLKYECPQITYTDNDLPIFWEKGWNSNIMDSDGNIYIDLTAAFGVANAGHSNPSVIKSANHQLDKLTHGMGDLHPTDLKALLAKKLAQITPGNLQQTIFSSSGSEAVESALKTAMFVTRKPGIIAFQGAYHGLTYGALTVTSWPYFRTPFLKQLSKHTFHLPYPNVYRKPANISGKQLLNITLETIYTAIHKQSKSKYPIGSIIVEPILGRGGIIIPPKGFLKSLRNLSKDLNVLLIVDEIFTGLGRTGQWFAVDHENVVPDILCIGKGLANGFPISACIGSKSVMQQWGKSKGEAVHTSTFLGNPLGCAMALATIKELENKKLPERSKSIGKYFISRLNNSLQHFDIIGDIRGKGLMIGIELVKNKKTKTPFPTAAISIMKSALKKGIILLPAGEHGNIVSITPPLTITKQQIDCSVDILHSCFKKVSA